MLTVYYACEIDWKCNDTTAPDIDLYVRELKRFLSKSYAHVHLPNCLSSSELSPQSSTPSQRRELGIHFPFRQRNSAPLRHNGSRISVKYNISSLNQTFFLQFSFKFNMEIHVYPNDTVLCISQVPNTNMLC